MELVKGYLEANKEITRKKSGPELGPLLELDEPMQAGQIQASFDVFERKENRLFLMEKLYRWKELFSVSVICFMASLVALLIVISVGSTVPSNGLFVAISLPALCLTSLKVKSYRRKLDALEAEEENYMDAIARMPAMVIPPTTGSTSITRINPSPPAGPEPRTVHS